MGLVLVQVLPARSAPGRTRRCRGGWARRTSRVWRRARRASIAHSGGRPAARYRQRRRHRRPRPSSAPARCHPCSTPPHHLCRTANAKEVSARVATARPYSHTVASVHAAAPDGVMRAAGTCRRRCVCFYYFCVLLSNLQKRNDVLFRSRRQTSRLMPRSKNTCFTCCVCGACLMRQIHN